MNILKQILGRIKRDFNTWYWRGKINIGKNTDIIRPLRIAGSKDSLNIGNDVVIHEGCWIECQPLTTNRNPRLVIGDGCVLGHYNEIYSTSEIVLEKYVLTADRVYISDNLHSYFNPEIPIVQQPILQNRKVRIGEGSWLGVNVCVLGATIGKHCIIGANSVVNKDIPDYCVVVGAPAYIVKRYDLVQKKWRKTEKNGNFFD